MKSAKVKQAIRHLHKRQAELTARIDQHRQAIWDSEEAIRRLEQESVLMSMDIQELMRAVPERPTEKSLLAWIKAYYGRERIMRISTF